MADIFAMVDTWNNGATTFTAIKMNVTDTDSAAGSLLMDLQVGGATKEKTSKAGDKTMTGIFRSLSRGSATVPALGMDNSEAGFWVPATGNIGVTIGTTDAYRMRVADFTIGTALLGWGTNVDAPDLLVGRDGPNIFAQRNGANAQKYSVYNSRTDTSNYERGGIDWRATANTMRISSEAAGTGTVRIIAIDGFLKAGAAVAGDIPAGTWALVRDTSGSTTKLIYNNAGTLMSVALT